MRCTLSFIALLGVTAAASKDDDVSLLQSTSSDVEDENEVEIEADEDKEEESKLPCMGPGCIQLTKGQKTSLKKFNRWQKEQGAHNADMAQDFIDHAPAAVQAMTAAGSWYASKFGLWQSSDPENAAKYTEWLQGLHTKASEKCPVGPQQQLCVVSNAMALAHEQPPVVPPFLRNPKKEAMEDVPRQLRALSSLKREQAERAAAAMDPANNQWLFAMLPMYAGKVARIRQGQRAAHHR